MKILLSYSWYFIIVVLTAIIAIHLTKDDLCKLEKKYLKAQITLCLFEFILFGGIGAFGLFLEAKGLSFIGNCLAAFVFFKIMFYSSVNVGYDEYLEDMAKSKNIDISNKSDLVIALYNKTTTKYLEIATAVIIPFAVIVIAFEYLHISSLFYIFEFLMIFVMVISVIIANSKIENDNSFNLLFNKGIFKE